MRTGLIVFQVILSILLALTILVQQRGSGMGVAISGGSGGGGFYSSKRGAEKFLEIATIVLGILFVLNALAFLFV
jgi:protein translocase SecG subunit